ncbi:alpha/beta fold hydrolase [Halogeometricum luteum]|uniref:Alpha/beta fold hydrolase n=1 Tax=Halogeometricum luteum TaxID=2950537 RepID=A0ABU2FVZ2_9EURY|nr:alpha/beta fold hydrolase [Halogeometricum sp. S3BR5-2]MDS0292705.1 alpha/beta fold hydrolase [Halogeometricum sp. S3BR5-2]
MRFSVHEGDGPDAEGPDDRPELLFVLGWGNEPEHDPVSWLIDRLTEEYRVHAVTLPTNGWDFEDQYLAPVRAYYEDRAFDAVLSHSTGGLVAAHLAAVVDVPPQVFLSPWWGTDPAAGVESVIFPYFLRLPTARRLFEPDRDRTDIGALKPEGEFEAGPSGISPAFLRTIVDAQARLPPFDPADAVFCTLSDRVVSVRAVGDRTPAANLRPYDGGHEFFASPGREAVVEDVLAALDGGAEAIR